ncbi:uncharacterized protein LOC134178272 isoform X2 [Corticium candelabrum]|uniref:uncharacterized protein LOC134178272 isoform X2 n=1 Tax=Corticium candelabrum TaxID=121492 RepID=UPI002E25C69F|nr:uncharacterized protein LOC134178272 isoform X2 [Corticium candelabrum]
MYSLAEDSSPVYVGYDALAVLEQLNSDRVHATGNNENQQTGRFSLDHSLFEREAIASPSLSPESHIRKERSATRISDSENFWQNFNSKSKLHERESSLSTHNSVHGLVSFNFDQSVDERVSGHRGFDFGQLLSTDLGVERDYLHSQSLLNNESTIVVEKDEYELKTLRAARFCAGKIQQQCLLSWHEFCCKRRHAAKKLYSRHLLRKGLEGLAWNLRIKQHERKAIRRHQDEWQQRHCFSRWYNRLEARRLQTMRRYLDRWITASRLYRKKQTVTTKWQMQASRYCWTVWHDSYQTRRMEKVADTHCRVVYLNLSIRMWRQSLQVRMKTTLMIQEMRAASNCRLMQSMFSLMRQSLKESLMAFSHCRHSTLYKGFSRWHRWCLLSRVRRQHRDTRSAQFRDSTILQKYWRRLRDIKQVRVAVRFNRVTLMRSVFLGWQTAAQFVAEKSHKLHELCDKFLMRHSFTNWKSETDDIRLKHFVAMKKLNHSMMRKSFRLWLVYIQTKIDLRLKLRLHLLWRDVNIQQICLSTWHLQHREKLLINQRHSAWSIDCTMKAYHRWRELVYSRCLAELLAIYVKEKEGQIVKACFGKWRTRMNHCLELAKTGRELNERLTTYQVLKIFKTWQLLMSRKIRAAALKDQQSKRQLGNCFVVWKEYVRKRKIIAKHQFDYERKQSRRNFDCWRLRLHEQLCSMEVNNFSAMRILRTALSTWKCVFLKRSICITFRQSVSQRVVQSCFVRWRTKWLIRHHVVSDQQASEARSQILMLTHLKLWQNQTQLCTMKSNQMGRLALQMHSRHVLCHTYRVWCRGMKTSECCRNAIHARNKKLLQKIFIAWHQLTKRELDLAVRLFELSVSVCSSPIKSMNVTNNLPVFSSCHDDSAVAFTIDDVSNVMDGVGSGILSQTDCAGRLSHILETSQRYNRSTDFGDTTVTEEEMTEPFMSKSVSKRDTALKVIGRLTLGHAVAVAFDAWFQLSAHNVHQRQKALTFQSKVLKHHLHEYFLKWQRRSMSCHTAYNHHSTQLLRKFFNQWIVYMHLFHQKQSKNIVALRMQRDFVLVTYFQLWKEQLRCRVTTRTIFQAWHTWAISSVMLRKRFGQCQKVVNRSATFVAFTRLVQEYRMKHCATSFRAQSLLRLFSRWKEATVRVVALQQRLNIHEARQSCKQYVKLLHV